MKRFRVCSVSNSPDQDTRCLQNEEVLAGQVVWNMIGNNVMHNVMYLTRKEKIKEN